MLKILLLPILMFTLTIPVSSVLAESVTKSFKISVTIPATTGFSDRSQSSTILSPADSPMIQLVQEQKTVRNNRTVIMRSIVVL